MELQSEPRKRRVMDTSNRDAREVIADVLGRFADWRQALAHFQARAERGFSASERADTLERCAQIEAELMAARTGLILSLADAPRQVAGNSRVVDVERALDNIEAAIAALRAKLH
jgi:hypothetical protein